MKFIVSGKNIDVTGALREKAIKKLGKIEKFFTPDTEVHVTMSVEKNRQIIEVTILFHGVVFRAEVATEDMYASIDKAADVLKLQIEKNKSKLVRRFHNHEGFASKDKADDTDLDEEGDDDEADFKVVKSKKFAMKPMPVDEAILQMNLIGHAFFVFSNSDTKKVNVVYKRNDGTFGLIEPAF